MVDTTSVKYCPLSYNQPDHRDQIVCDGNCAWYRENTHLICGLLNILEYIGIELDNIDNLLRQR